ncbi:CRTAC1 family protein [Sphingobium sp. CR2-8]|uniref:CRTAC1 family protein n=1 Tax=Sphingobium sp. CR2-8 TaxID=1306534 RepID=UPI002DB7B248|nr:CRTAC1 family protein [Sphingobium sp. CR2-8]MEC3909383.1 CRTAC1 family protein [Sphingobium sp. CR2-8]
MKPSLSKTLACTLPMLLALQPAIAGGQAVATPSEPPFTSIQPTDFAIAGSLSNSWADFDKDGDLDLAVSLKGGDIRLYRNDKGKFVNIGPALGLPSSGPEMRGVAWGDYDGDGWVDLLGGATMPDQLSLVFHNQGGKKFTNVAPELGLTIPGRSARQSSWLDYDNDGDLDLYASNRIGPNALFRNDNGKFVQIFAGTSVSDPRPTVGACWFDADRDGDLDLFLANQSGATDALWRNDGDSFTDIAAQAGVDNPGRTKEEGGVGCAVGDYDNDGYLDLFVPNYGVNALYHNNRDGTFSNLAKAMGVGIDNHAVGAVWGDYDNDGFIDLFVTSYHGERNQQQPKDSLFHNDGGKGFTQVLTETSKLNVGDHGVQWVDYDADGAIDLSVMRGYTDKGGHFLFRNAMPKAEARRSLSVTVLDASGHFTKMGSEVRLLDKTGKILATRQVSTGDGYNSENAAPVHFGLTSLAPVTVEVTFMGKNGRTVQTIPSVSPAKYAGKSLVVRQNK